MLNKLFKKAKLLKIYAPINGEIVPLESVPDPVFSQKMMGEGVAIIPNNGNVSSPVEGEVVQVAPTKHAVGLRAEDGTEVLIHVGLETVELKGNGFSLNVNVGDKVSVGDSLMEVDLNYIRENAENIITPIVITNSQESGKSYEITNEKSAAAGETIIISSGK
ncbi:PTS system glucose-specific IIA component [Evansella vedderi]|uniref:PTS system glucose-specific IIA component n=1 Tax=Evansella vedderi TaxID=38282 RepID=A0ABT9ZZH1_9BACI|nr:PTS glucose transporter subunit IIA [Evansella vedderi]MDQ0256633.1 PTS system glucose-specific IIA component [Evansella vedderi]